MVSGCRAAPAAVSVAEAAPEVGLRRRATDVAPRRCASDRQRLRPRGAVEPADAPGATTSGRPVALRMARVHLRTGQLALARAELEALAGRAALDEPALLDLAEARWRTGDLAGPARRPQRCSARGRDDALALLIAAEAVAAEGRPGEARRLVDPGPRALARGLAGPVFRRDAAEPDLARRCRRPSGPRPPARLPGRRPQVPLTSAAEPIEAPASAAAAEAFAGGRAALAGGRRGDRGAPARASPCASTRASPRACSRPSGTWERDPALALVAGDALRLLGREAEALVAFDLARESRLSSVPSTDPDPDHRVAATVFLALPCSSVSRSP